MACVIGVTCTLQNVHWTELMSSSPGSDSVSRSALTENERKRLEAVWELFQSETVFLIDHLMVLKHVRISRISSSSL